MSDYTLEQRQDRAEIALEIYVKSKGEVFEQSVDEIVDLIADLLHLVERYDAPPDVDLVLGRAKGHWDTERIDEFTEEEDEVGDLIPFDRPSLRKYQCQYQKDGKLFAMEIFARGMRDAENQVRILRKKIPTLVLNGEILKIGA